MTKLSLRQTTPDDLPALDALYPQAFPEEDLRPLLRDLLALRSETLSLAACESGALSGHIVFSLCDVGKRAGCAALLGPLAVSPARQRRGIGSALIREGLKQLTALGPTQVLVLGDPRYYGRFGFQPERRVRPPYPLPEAWSDAWRALNLTDAPQGDGELNPPAPWRNPALWDD